jgi:hypothetical protein
MVNVSLTITGLERGESAVACWPRLNPLLVESMINAAADDYVASRSAWLSVVEVPMGEGRTSRRGMQPSATTDDILVRLPQVSEAVACKCADALIRAGMMNADIAASLVRRGDKASLMVLSEGLGLSDKALVERAGSGSDDEARAIAAAPRLAEGVLLALIARADPVIDRTLAECSGEPLAEAVLDTLVHRAMADPRLARLLLSRSDLSLKHRVALFASATPRERMALLTLARLQERDKPHGVDADRVSALAAAIESGSAPHVTRLLSEALGLSAALLYPMLGEASGAVLALALKGIDVPDAVIRRACRWVGSAHAGMPGGVEDILETVSVASARWMMAAMVEARQDRAAPLPLGSLSGERLRA